MQKILYLFTGILLAITRLAMAQAAATDSRTLEFIPNQGQWPSSVRYAGAVPGGHLYLEPDGLRYVLLQGIKHPHQHARPAAGGKAAAEMPHLPASDSLVRGHQVRVLFVGADAATPLVPAETTGEVRNYFYGNDPAHWAHQVPSYRQVRYEAPWPGIGARFYENQHQQLEYDFELAAGADPALVQLKYEGASSLTLGRDGRLHIGTSLGELTELAPQAYQVDAASGAHHPVACHYRLHPDDATVTFELGRYDHRRPLIIDPTVLFSTYSGATGDNWGFTATYDAAGNMYSGGIVFDYRPAGTLGPGYPTSPGAFQTTFGGLVDIAIIKYNTALTGPAARVWATYLGGNASDFPTSLVVNSQNELVVLGTTSSANYPTTASALQRSFAGGTGAAPFGAGGIYYVNAGTDLIVTRFNSTGSALQASTYLGGSANDGFVPYNRATTVRQLPQNYGDTFRGDVVTDAAGNIYVASVTASSNFPVTTSSFGPTRRGGSCDAVVLKLPPALNALTWGGYLGGSADDAAYSLQLDASSNVYVAGGTLSSNFPVTAGALTTTAPGDVDGFVARIAANGTSVQKASYIGTSAYDQTQFVQLGADGGVYLLGQTMGNWPVSAGVYSNAGSRQFIQKMSADLDQRLLSTVFGSGRPTLDISPTAFLVDQCDRVYVCGWGGDVNQNVYNTATFNFNGYTHGMPVTANAVRSTPDTPGAGSDFYLGQFTPGLTQLVYGTYYGNAGNGSEGDHVDGGTSRFDPRGVAYTAVCSCFDAAGFPVPPEANTYSTTNGTGGSNCNNAAFKLNFEPQSISTGGAVTVCLNAAPVVLAGTPAGGIWSGPGVSGSAAGGFAFTPSTTLLGQQVLTYSIPGVVTACTITGTKNITVVAPPQVTATALPAVCPNNGPVALTTGTPAGGTWSGPGVSSSAAGGFVFTPSVALIGTQTLTYSVAGAAAGCAGQATATVQVLPGPVAITLAADTALCPGSATPFQLRASVAGGVWSGPGVTASGLFTPPATPGTITVTYLVGGNTLCPTSATRRITLLPTATLAAVARPVRCDSITGLMPAAIAPYTVQFSQPAFAGLPGAVLTWDFGDGSPLTTGFSVVHTYRAAGTYRAIATLRFNNGNCSSQTVLAPIQVGEMFIPNIFTPNGDQLNERFAPRIGGCPPRLQVFSRWGQKVYESAAYLNNWDGAGLSTGVYFFLLTPPDGSAPIKGWVELTR